MLAGDAPQPPAKALLLLRPPRCGQPLRGAVLAHHPAGPALGNPETGPEPFHGSAAPFRGQKFPSANSLSIALSSSASARSFFSRAFSDSNSRSLFAPSAFIPPY